MAKGNLRGLNPTTGARNSLNRPTGGSTTIEHPSKRQRLDRSSPASVRLSVPFPPEKKPAFTEPIRDGVDQYDIETLSNSTGNAGNGKQNSCATQGEFRKVQALGGSQKTGRRRRRRSHARNSIGTSSRESPVVYAEEIPTSPDRPDPLNLEPPPSNVTSDVAPSRRGAKRQRQSSLSEPAVKRPKATSTKRETIDDDADELTWSPSNKMGSRKADSGAVTPSNERRSRSKADIQPTTFSSSKKKPQSHARRDEKSFAIKRAVCSKHMIESTPTEKYSLVPSYKEDGKTIDELRLRVEKVDEGGVVQYEHGADDEVVRCMGIDFAKIQSVSHMMTHREFLIIHRSSSPGRPPKLLIEFMSVLECSRIVELFPFKLCSQTEGDLLEKSFKHQWQVAMGRQDQSQETGISHDQSKRASAGQQQFVVELPARRQTRGKERLIDQMRKAKDETKEQRITSDLTGDPPEPTPAPISFIPRIRRSRRSMATNEAPDDTEYSYFAPQPTIVRWTAENPGWETRWPQSLVYPATGRNRAVVDVGDIGRLDEGQCLNDNIINFYLRWLKVKLERAKPGILKKVHVFESYFFERLKTSKYQGVRSWTAKMDLLSYDYIVVPVNENFHWYVAIICNVAKALPGASTSENDEEQPVNGGETPSGDPSIVAVVRERVEAISIDDSAPKSSSTVKDNGEDPYLVASTPPPAQGASNAPKSKGKKSNAPSTQKFNPTEPRIITLDSLGSAHSPTCRILREYLAEEAMDKKGVELEGSVPGMTAKGIPIQDNGVDCGTYTLAFIEKFLRAPEEVSRQLLLKERFDWEVDSYTMRADIRTMLFTLQEEQQERLKQELLEKKARKRNRSLANGGAMSSPGPTMVPSASQEVSRKAASKYFASSPPSGGRASADAFDGNGVVESTPIALESPQPRDKRRSAPIGDEQPRLVSPLLNSDENTPGERSDAFYSARATPTPKQRGKTHPSSSKKSASKNVTPQPTMIEEIPSSDSEVEEVVRQNKNQPTIDIEDEQEPIVHSIEQDEEDPIQRSIEPDEKQPRPKTSVCVERDGESFRPRTSQGIVSSMGNFFGVKGKLWQKSPSQSKKDISYDGIDRS